MAASHKFLFLCVCYMLASLSVLVDGHGMFGGLMGGGGGKGHGHGHGALETLLAAGLLAKLLKSNNHHHHHGGHYHGRHSHEGRAAYGIGAYAVPYAYDYGYLHGFGY